MVKVDWLNAVLRNGPEGRGVEVNGSFLSRFYRDHSVGLELREDWQEHVDALRGSGKIYSKGLIYW